MNASDLVTINPEISDGVPVFTGTHVPVQILFKYLADNYSLEEFLECFPSVTREQAGQVLACAAAGLAAAARRPAERMPGATS
jgi:uncharacterized protein (DUF433 family)